MSSFIEDGASDISAFASIPLSDAFRRLPTSTHTFIGFSMVISVLILPFEATPVGAALGLPGSHVRAYAVAGDLTVLVKSGLRFSRKAENASLASSERTCALESSFSAVIAVLN